MERVDAGPNDRAPALPECGTEFVGKCGLARAIEAVDGHQYGSSDRKGVDRCRRLAEKIPSSV